MQRASLYHARCPSCFVSLRSVCSLECECTALGNGPTFHNFLLRPYTPLKLLSHPHASSHALAHTTIYPNQHTIPHLQLVYIYYYVTTSSPAGAKGRSYIAVRRMSGLVEMERPQEIASKVLRRAQVSKVSLYRRYRSLPSIPNLHEDGTHPTRPPGIGECQGEAWMAEPQSRNHRTRS